MAEVTSQRTVTMRKSITKFTDRGKRNVNQVTKDSFSDGRDAHSGISGFSNAKCSSAASYQTEDAHYPKSYRCVDRKRIPARHSQTATRHTSAGHVPSESVCYLWYSGRYPR